MRKTTRKTHNGQRAMPTGAYRYCVHSANGASGMAKICVFGYECSHCAFDQWLEEASTRESVPETGRTTGLTYGLALAA
jgi:hypothetical protein